jgi:putative zinc finger/helix-turn-helix YgiT family protein
MRNTISCYECRKNSKTLVVERYTSHIVTHDGIDCLIDIPDLLVYRCQTANCLAPVSIPDESDNKISDEIRKQAKLLMPSEIREHREQLGWSQEEFAHALGFGVATVSRWESGGQIQSRLTDQTIRNLSK